MLQQDMAMMVLKAKGRIPKNPISALQSTKPKNSDRYDGLNGYGRYLTTSRYLAGSAKQYVSTLKPFTPKINTTNL